MQVPRNLQIHSLCWALADPPATCPLPDPTVEVRYDPSGFCNYNRYCTDAAMSSTCDLYANDDGTSTPDSPYLCDRIFSPSMRYALVLERDSDLAVYDYGTEAGDSWTLVSAIVTGALFGRAQEHQLTLDAEGNWYINYSALGRDVSSSIYGISMGEYRGSDKAPFRLTLGDDGIVRLLNREDQVAWLSSLPAPPQPPPSPPSPPPSPPATPAPPGERHAPGRLAGLCLLRAMLRRVGGSSCPAGGG